MEANTMKAIIKEYEMTSGRMINFEKSLVYFSGNIGDSMQGHITNILDVRVMSHPELYLGLPTMVMALAVSLGVRNLEVEGDSETVTKRMKATTNNRSILRPVFC